MWRFFEPDLLPKPVKAKNINAVWISKIFPGQVMEIVPSKRYLKILDPQGVVMWITIDYRERTLFLTHKMSLRGHLAESGKAPVLLALAKANEYSRHNVFSLRKEKRKNAFIYATSGITLSGRIYPLEFSKTIDIHWKDFRKGFNTGLYCYCLRSRIV